MWRAIGCLSLTLMGVQVQEDLIQMCIQHDLYQSATANIAAALAGSRLEGAFERAKQRANDPHRYRLDVTSGWNMLAGLAETPQEISDAYKIIMADEGNKYRDMGPYVYPCAAIVNPEAQDELYTKIKNEVDSYEVAERYDGAFYALALVGLALTCSDTEKPGVFQKCKEQREHPSCYESKFAFLGMGLAARNDEELKINLREQAGEVLTTLRNWNGNVALSAMLAMAISTCENPLHARRASASLMHGPTFWSYL
jgi:hypothetical protein